MTCNQKTSTFLKFMHAVGFNNAKTYFAVGNMGDTWPTVKF